MEDLRKWTVQHKPTNSSLNDLLVLLTEYGFKLPKDGRALLKTDDVFIEPMGQGKFWYQGVSNCLHKTLSDMDLSTISSIELMFNVDGMSLFNTAYAPHCQTNTEYDCARLAVRGLSDVVMAVASTLNGYSAPLGHRIKYILRKIDLNTSTSYF